MVIVAAVAGVLSIAAARRRRPEDNDVDLIAIPFGSALLTGIFLSSAGLTVL